MALSTITLTSAAPRGGPVGTSVTLVGSGFGVAQGTIRFDPNDENVAASITSWVDNQIVFVVPTMNFDDRFYDVLLELSTLDDSVSFKWWIPVVVLANQVLDYQYPANEAGTAGESADDPRLSTAGDFNRLLDRALLNAAFVAGTSGDWAGSAPVTVADAINRLAAAYAATHSPVP